MKIGIICYDKLCIPLLATLHSGRIAACVFAEPHALAHRDQAELKAWCQQHHIYVTEENLYAWADDCAPTLLFVIGYAKKIDLSLMPQGLPIYNIHFGPLPQYRGPSPVFWQLKEGRKKVGLTIHLLSEKLDAGPVAWQKEVDNQEHFTYSYVHLLFSQLLVEGVLQLIQAAQTQKSIALTQQDEAEAVLYSRPGLADVCINWEQMTALEICQLVKACNAWNTGALTSLYGNELVVIDASVDEAKAGDTPGTIADAAQELYISCRGGQLLKVGYLRLNQLSFPARWAARFGLAKGQKLGT